MGERLHYTLISARHVLVAAAASVSVFLVFGPIVWRLPLPGSLGQDAGL
jgi:hypothetical protein